MFVPQVWLYGLAVVSAGVLQAHHRFLAAALAPLLSSVVVIGAYLVFAALAPADAGDLTALTAVGRWPSSAGARRPGSLALALTTLVPLGRLGLRLRPTAAVRRRRPPGDRPDRRRRRGRAGPAAAQRAA